MQSEQYGDYLFHAYQSAAANKDHELAFQLGSNYVAYAEARLEQGDISEDTRILEAINQATNFIWAQNLCYDGRGSMAEQSARVGLGSKARDLSFEAARIK